MTRHPDDAFTEGRGPVIAPALPGDRFGKEVVDRAEE
jgi:hypothetical protein